MTLEDFRRALKRKILEFIKTADSPTTIGIPLDVVLKHILNIRYPTYSDYTYDEGDVSAAITELKSGGQVLCYRVNIELPLPEDMTQRFPDIHIPSRVLVLKYAGE